MSVTKRKLEKMESYYNIAYNILLEIGAIEECNIHQDFYYETNRLDEALIYAMCAKKLKEQYGESQDFKLFNSQIDKIIKSASSSSLCPFCEKE